MSKKLRGAWEYIRDHTGVLAVGCALLMAFLAAFIRLLPPAARWIPLWLFIFGMLFLLGLIASFVHQRASRNQIKRQTEMLEKIAVAVGATQAEAADTAADTKRQIVALQVRINDESKPVVVIRFNVDGDKDALAMPSVENIGKGSATNIRIEDISVPGNRGPGKFTEIDVLNPGETRKVDFYAEEEGPLFGEYLIKYLGGGLESRPPFDWSKVKTEEDAHDLFAPMKMPISVVYTDPGTGKRYRSAHELEFTFSKHVSVIFQQQTEIA